MYIIVFILLYISNTINIKLNRYVYITSIWQGYHITVMSYATVVTAPAVVNPETVTVHLERDPATATATATATAENEYWPLTFEAVRGCDLTYFGCDHSADMVRDGMRAILITGQEPRFKNKEMNVWKYLSEYSPPSDRGFMFSAGDDTVVSAVQNNMETGHSGCSMGWTMRQIEFIAKNGVPAHRNTYLNRRREQQQAMRREQCNCRE